MTPAAAVQWLAEHRVKIASAAAIVAFAAVLIVGFTQIDASTVDGPRESTSVTTPAVPAKEAMEKSTTVVERGPKGRVTKRTRTVERSGATPEVPAGTTVTVKEGERTFLERILGDDGRVILQYAVLLLAAFLAAAAVQRVAMGRYGIKIAGLELAEISENTADGLEELRKKLTATVLQRIAFLEGKVDGG